MPDNLSLLLNEASLLASIAGLVFYSCFIFSWALPARRQAQALAELNRKLRALPPGASPAELFAGNAGWTAAWAEFDKVRQQDGAGASASGFFTRSVLIDASVEKPSRFSPNLIGTLGVLGLLLGGAACLGQSTDDGAAMDPGTLLAIILSFVPMSLAVAAVGFLKQLPEPLPALADEVAQILNSLPAGAAAPQPQAAARAAEPARVDEAAAARDMLARVLGEVLAAQIGRQTMSLQSATANISGDMVKSVARAMEQPLSQMVKATEAAARQTEGIEMMMKETTSAMARDIALVIGRSFEKPLARMVEVVEQSGRQAENVDRLLQSTMMSMVAKVEQAAQEQIKGLHDMRINVAQMMDDLKKNTEYISGLTNASIEKMDLSARTILGAAEKFGEAGEVMNSQISHAHSLSRHMMESGAALNGSSQALAQVVADYGKARESIAGLVGALQGIVKDVDQKVTINQSLVADMQKVADRLKEVQAQTDQYLHQVSDVLSTGFNGFGKSVHENLDRSTSAFHTSMSSSVELISVQMRNLTSALQELPELLRKSA